MIGALQCNAYRVTQDVKYLDRAARQLTAYIPRLQQPSGLYRHGLDSPYLWARGNGWVAASLTELLQVLPAAHPQRPALLAAYRKMMTGLVERIGDDGTVKDVCCRTGQKNALEYYLTRHKIDGDPHGQAAALWAASAMTQLK